MQKYAIFTDMQKVVQIFFVYSHKKTAIGAKKVAGASKIVLAT